MRTGYWVGGLLILAAMVGATLLVASRVLSIDDQVEGWPRAAYAEGTVFLDAGEYHVYIDADRPLFRDLPALVTAQDGQVLHLRRPNSSFRYEFGDHYGRLIGYLDVPRAGRYVFRGTGGPPDAEVLFGDGLIGGFVGTVLAAIALFLFFAAAGAVLIIRTAAGRRAPQEAKRWP